jgi:TetR/AcrR family transcriptional repressor of nem operon
MAVEPVAELRDTRSAILDIAERLVQRRGFNGFSYADVAGEIGITRAALHYHFPAKVELGEELIIRYAARFFAALAAIDRQEAAAVGKLRAYTDLYLDTLRHGRMCVCGILAAEYETLPGRMRHAVVSFFDDNQAWLAGVLEAGRAQGGLRFPGDPEDAAQMTIGALEGAMLVARIYGDTARFKTVTDRLVASFVASWSPTPPAAIARDEDAYQIV